MSNIDLYASPPSVFGGKQNPLDKARYVIFGVPFDATSSYRTGARFMPNAVRQASLNIETFCLRCNEDFEDVPIHDAGDLDVSLDVKQTVSICKAVTADILEAGKIPVAIGGEHTVTLGILKGYGEKGAQIAVVCFDAHLDLREEYLGVKLSHTTFMRLVNEQIKPAKIIEVGTRSVCQEELNYARRAKIEFITTQDIKEQGPTQIVKKLRNMLAPFENLYISIDLDVLDPAFAPATQNPEADGITTGDLLDIACALCDERVAGFDVLEVAPVYDNGTSAVVAAKLLFEMMCQLEKSRKDV